MLPGGIAHDTPVQLRSLGIFALLALVRVMAFARDYIVRHGIRRLSDIRSKAVFEAVRHVLLVAGMVGVGSHRTIKVQAGVLAGHKGAIDGDLVQIDADTVILGIAVEEHAELKQWVRAIFDARYHASRRECRLLDVAVIVLRILVEDQVSEFVHGKLVPRPDFGHIKGIEAELVCIGFIGLHDLDVGFPGDFLTFLDGFPELLLGVVGVLARGHDGFRLGELLLAVGGEKVIFDVDKLALRVDPGKQSGIEIMAEGERLTI